MSNASRWVRFLASLNERKRDEFLKWFQSRPTKIQALARDFPPDSVLRIEGRRAWMVGYQEAADQPPGLLLSFINPTLDYRGAYETRFYVCADHLERSS